MNNYTYIRKNTKDNIISLENELQEGYEVGTTWEDYTNGKWVLLSNEQVEFYDQYPLASIKEIFNMQITPKEQHIEDQLKNAKDHAIKELEFYDLSQAVNSFDVINSNYVSQVIEPVEGEEPVEDNGGTITSWLTPAERANYRSSIDAAELIGLQEISLYVGDMPITLSVQNAKMMLAQIQLYADQCFIVTKHHKAAIEALDTVEAINNYDFTIGYPQRLKFTI